MKELTPEEFEDRVMALHRARKIFIKSGITDNISLAFEMYQKIFAERERQIFISTNKYGDRPQAYLDKYERPSCPDCGREMMFRIVPENKEGIKTQLVCSNNSCDTVLNSENDLQWWMDNLKVKNVSGSNAEGSEEDKQKR